MDYISGIEAMAATTGRPAGGRLGQLHLDGGADGYVVRTQAHMHLLGVSFSMVLDPGTPKQRTILAVPRYDFHNQKAYNLAEPVRWSPGTRWRSRAPTTRRSPRSCRRCGMSRRTSSPGQRLVGRDVHRPDVAVEGPAAKAG